MKILHISDTHGSFPPFMQGEYDVIVHSGDLLPNKTRGNRDTELEFQKDWLRRNISRFDRWIGTKPFLFCPGNHDYFNPIPALKMAGFEAIDLANEFIEYMGVKFYGFPWVPRFTGEWNYELYNLDLRDKVWEALAQGAEVLVAHCPPYGLLDHNVYGECCGSLPLTDYINYEAGPKPKWILSGHLHESGGGVAMFNGITVVNSATTCRIIEV